MVSVTKDIADHLLADAAIAAIVDDRVFAVQVPDKTPLQYILIERPSSTTELFSTGSLVHSNIVITSFGATANDAEALATLVDTRMQTVFISTAPARTVDSFPEDDGIKAEEQRGKDGIFRYVAPLSYRVLREVPR